MSLTTLILNFFGVMGKPLFESLATVTLRNNWGNGPLPDLTYTAVHTGSQKQVPPRYRIWETSNIVTSSCPVSPPKPVSQSLAPPGALALMGTRTALLPWCGQIFGGHVSKNHRINPQQSTITHCTTCVSLKNTTDSKSKFSIWRDLQRVMGNTPPFLIHIVNVIPTLQFSSTSIPKASSPFPGKAASSTFKGAPVHRNSRQNFQLLPPHSCTNDTTATCNL